MRQPLRVLMVEDSEDDALLMIRALERGGFDPVVERVETARAMQQSLQEKPWDVILCDYQMPQFNGLAALALLKEAEIDIPFIVVSGAIGEEMAVECLRLGARDYIMKDNLHRLASAVERELKEAESRCQRKRAEEAAARAAWEWQTTFDATNDAIWILDQDQRVLRSNKTAERYFQRQRGEMIGKHCWEITHGTEQPIPECPILRVKKSLQRETMELQEGLLWFQVTVDPILNAAGRYSGAVHIISDITGRKQAEEALKQSEDKFRLIFQDSPDAININSLKDGQYVDINQSFTNLTGFTREDAIGPTGLEKTIWYDPADRKRLAQGLREQGYYENLEAQFRRKDGSLITALLSAKVIMLGEIPHIISISRDISERKLVESLFHLRLSLWEFANTHSLAELLQKTLDEVGTLTNSPIGFYHLVDWNQKTLNLQSWSTRTIKEFCAGEGIGMHYPIDQAGVLVDCVRKKKPVIHNDFKSLPHRKGMPEGHATVTRELVVPIMKSDRIVAILGIGNKPTDYTENDVQIVSYLADVAWNITERKLTEEALKESEEKYRQIIENSQDLIYTIGPEGKFLFISPAISQLLGYDEATLIGRPFQTMVHPDDVAACEESLRQTIKGIRNPGFQYRIRHVSGNWRWFNSRGGIVYDNLGNYLYFQGVARDITDQFRLEEQLRQAQRMEAVGRLAGGVAHDFNNLLTTILGNAQMALMDMVKDDPLYATMNEIREAGDRAARVTGQLLAFSRKQVFQLEVTDLNEAVSEINKILRRLIGEDIELQTILSPTLGLVEADVGQIEQVIMNLAVNARDAMPGGGKLTIETANADLDEAYVAGHVAATSGPYVILSISDTGTGMSTEVQSHVFEPFFTTKEKGKGTGLGLSTVYGIVKQSRGYIWVYSEEGQGTTFKIYLPRVDKADKKEKGKGIKEEVRGGSETVLVVEDEESVRNLAMRILQGYGYQVLTAANGQEALEIFERHDGPIHLILTDVVMPRMSGKELAVRMGDLQPGIKVLFMSGYTDNAIVHHGILDKGIAFIQKPFTPEGLARKVNEVLEDKHG
jgi:PAS domain S-box-containing protein